jgi:hypothetical protein
MQSLVRVIASVDQVGMYHSISLFGGNHPWSIVLIVLFSEARAILTELLDYNIVSLISVCLRSGK